ncbi:protein phosphatase CheZ [Venenivibrio stagnispumantis]|uniref:Chemotaxis protein CheZ n=1 Tax=Venenivibrio stagnispumantis TaxID=407998 RepID=A0AA45WNQ7_9AQUI|nr:protein phosphatase CheZ [Venenivibrio stagnispumantis]MCW4573910.1 protein phosphatase CheZ [Venenivibrio stagnispumantis]SMP18749.1 chemotaxis protein CheZ [Venenivibrio stagnispumantis]
MEDIKKELDELVKKIKELEGKIEENTKPIEEASSFLPSAADSLRDVMKFTEQKTKEIIDILDLVEENNKVINQTVKELLSLNPIEPIKSKLELIKEKNEDNMNQILLVYTTLSFQDLSAQQIKNVIEALEDIKKILIKIIISSIEAGSLHVENKDKVIGKATEMLTGDRIFQEDVDNILKELGL